MAKLTIIKLKLGSSYMIGDWKQECVFIKTTPKGFNFLDLKTHTCQLERGLYQYKGREIDLNGYYSFVIPFSMKIWELNKKTNEI